MGRLEEQAWAFYNSDKQRDKDRMSAEYEAATRAALARRQQEADIAARLQLSAMEGGNRLSLADMNNRSAERQLDQRGYYDTALQDMRNRAALDQGLQSWGKARDLESLRGGLDMQKMQADYGFRDQNAEKDMFRRQAIVKDQQFDQWLQQMGQQAQRFAPAAQKAWGEFTQKLQQLEAEYQNGSLQGRPEQYLQARQQLFAQGQSLQLPTIPMGERPGDVVQKNGIMFLRQQDGTWTPTGPDPNQEVSRARLSNMGMDEIDPVTGHKIGVRYFDNEGNIKVTPLNQGRSSGAAGGQGNGFDVAGEYEKAYAEEETAINKGVKPGMPRQAPNRDAVMERVRQKMEAIEGLRTGNIPSTEVGEPLQNGRPARYPDTSDPDNEAQRIQPRRAAPQEQMGQSPPPAAAGRQRLAMIAEQARRANEPELQWASQRLLALQQQYPNGNITDPVDQQHFQQAVAILKSQGR